MKNKGGEPSLVAGPEVLSRRIMIFDKSANDFLPGAVAAFDAKTGASSFPFKAHIPRVVILHLHCNKTIQSSDSITRTGTTIMALSIPREVMAYIVL